MYFGGLVTAVLGGLKNNCALSLLVFGVLTVYSQVYCTVYAEFRSTCCSTDCIKILKLKCTYTMFFPLFAQDSL